MCLSLSKVFFSSSTLIVLLFSEQNMFHSRSLWRFFFATWLSQKSVNRGFYFNFLCLLELNNKIYFSLKYYSTKYLLGYFHRLAFFSKRWRILLLHLEHFRQRIPKKVFHLDFFCYFEFRFQLPLILPFKRYLLRLDIYSFFFLWSAIEALRICFYNQYIRSHPFLVLRPHLRHCLIQAWFPRRRAYLSLRGLPILHLSPFERGSLRQRLSERFSIMLFHKKYTILNLLQSKSFLFRRVGLPFDLGFVFKKNATLHWLSSLSGAEFSIFGLLLPWAWAQLCRLFFLYSMRHPKRYTMDRWRLTRYFKFFTRSLIQVFFTAELFIVRSVRTYSLLFARRLYHQLFSSKFVQHAFFLQDLYHYHSFSWEIFSSFIDRRFCYRVLSMKFNWFFDSHFLKAHSYYMNVTFSLLRPFPRKPTPQQLVPRRRAFFFAKRFLLRFCPLPLFLSFTLFGLEYFYWRIYEYHSWTTWLDGLLPMAYFYLKLDIDRLLLSRYRSMGHLLETSKREAFPRFYKDESSSLMRHNKPIFHRQRWSQKINYNSLNPWILLHFSALKSIFLQSLNSSLPLTLVTFYLLQETSSLKEIEECWGEVFFSRSLVFLENVQKIHSFIFVDHTVFPRQSFPCEGSTRSKTSLAISRYGAKYPWLMTNKQTLMD